MLRPTLLIALLLAPTVTPTWAHAKVKLCLGVRADKEQDGLLKLLRAQLLHHPTIKP